LWEKIKILPWQPSSKKLPEIFVRHCPSEGVRNCDWNEELNNRRLARRT
jgi:hypothetical protein